METRVYSYFLFFAEIASHLYANTSHVCAAGLEQSDDSDAPCLSVHLYNPAVNLNVKYCVSAVSSNHMSRMCIHPQSAALCRCHCVPIHLPLSVSVITRLKKKIIPSLLSRAQALEQHKWKDLKAICWAPRQPQFLISVSRATLSKALWGTYSSLSRKDATYLDPSEPRQSLVCSRFLKNWHVDRRLEKKKMSQI